MEFQGVRLKGPWEAASPLESLAAFTTSRRLDVTASLPNDTSDFCLSSLKAALKPGANLLHYEFEGTSPLRPHYEARCFDEALLRLHGPNAIVPVEKLMTTLDEQPGQAGAGFRLFLTFDQIKKFYSTHDATDRLSLNVRADDLDSPHVYRMMATGLDLAQKAGYQNIILEAVENAPWTKSRRATLKNLVTQYNTGLAIDDYGAPNGYNDVNTLKAFFEDGMGTNLIVKIDGAPVRDFIEKGDTALIDRLKEIKAVRDEHTAYTMLVLAERVRSAEEAIELEKRLEPYQLNTVLGMVQSRYITATPTAFLQELRGEPVVVAPRERLPEFTI